MSDIIIQNPFWALLNTFAMIFAGWDIGKKDLDILLVLYFYTFSNLDIRKTLNCENFGNSFEGNPQIKVAGYQ